MNHERDEEGDGPENVEELDAPDLTGEDELEGPNVWADDAGDPFGALQSAQPGADITHEEELSEFDSSSIGPSRPAQNQRGERDAQDSVSALDDTQSLQGTPTPSVLDRPRINSPRGSLKPFDRRFQAKRAASGGSFYGQAVKGPGHLTPHSRTSSVSTRAIANERETETEEAPWEVVQWRRLGRLTSEVFSEPAKRKFGRITCMAVTTFVALGTSRGVVLVFDASQQLKNIIGEGTRAIESGSVTAIAISADYSTVASGHANGNIFTWEVARPAKPFLQIISSAVGDLRSATKDGHVAGVSVLHLGFLGIRRTALVSADDKGMAFSHLATRGMGALGRVVKTTRILGRYPDNDGTNPHGARPKKPSSVLAFSPLPMGTAEYRTDSVGLVAMLTPYLLVIVSTTPVAQTQHKVFRPKDVTPHSAMSGALAWFPAMQDEFAPDRPNQPASMPKLAYCWSNVLQIMEILVADDEDDREGPPDLLFTDKASWRCEEPLVAIHWLSRNIIAALTISQQLIILEYPTLRPTDSSDLLHKHIYHVDLFSPHLSQMVEKLDEEDSNMHGVVADAFYMSFRAYKGRLFLLGFNDVAVGALSNWADRLVATMKHGDYVGAIKLASSYYAGSVDVAAVGLPLSESERHTIVGEKLLELMTASLRYAFGQIPDTADLPGLKNQLGELAAVCFDACESLENANFLFDEVYSWFAQDDNSNKAQYQGLFFDVLQERIMEGKITIIPPTVLRALVEDFAKRGLHDSLEELLCRLNPVTMDLDQVTKLCKRHELFDALFYVWSQGINDYSTILGELLDAIDRGRISEDSDVVSKIYTYLSYTLTGRTYPSGQDMESTKTLRAKAEIYAFLCLGSRASADGSRTKLHRLRQLLNLDTAAFMSMLNEAFEDSFLNGSEEREGEDELDYLTNEQQFGLTLNRQFVLDILLDFVSSSDLEANAIVFLDMFVARSVAKYPNNILLKGQVLHNVLRELCEYSTEETAEDCQLSVEYLLSSYHPPDLFSLIPVLHQARFFRVIKSIYRSEGQYDKLLGACVEDQEHPEDIYECIKEYFRPGSSLSTQQTSSFRKILLAELSAIMTTDIAKTAEALDKFTPDLHQAALDTVQADDHAQYVYLREIMEPPSNAGKPRRSRDEAFASFNETYLRLLCDFDPHHVRSYIEKLNYGDLKLESVLPALESSGMIDSAVVLMARNGQVSQGVERLVKHLHTLGSALRSLLERAEDAPDSANIVEAADDLATNLDKYAHVGVWLCNRHGQVKVNGTDTEKQSKAASTKADKDGRKSAQQQLTPAENLWLELIDNVVQVSRNVNEVLEDGSMKSNSNLNLEDLLEKLRKFVQSVFTALLQATTSATPAPRFLPILRAFLGRASKSSPSLTHLREVLSAIFSAYTFEEGILGLANQLLDKDLFVGVEEVAEQRKRGWRPLGLACGGCGKKLWGPGAGREIWEQWYDQERQDAARREGQPAEDANDQTRTAGTGKGKGKGKQKEDVAEQARKEQAKAGNPDSVVVFACRHLFHQRCLRDLLGPQEDSVHHRYVCPLEG